MRLAARNRNSVAGMRWRRISNAVVAGTVLVMGAAAWAQGQTYTKKVIYSFAGGSDGADPLAGTGWATSTAPPMPAATSSGWTPRGRKRCSIASAVGQTGDTPTPV